MHLPNGAQVFMSKSFVLSTRTRAIRPAGDQAQVLIDLNHSLLSGDYFILTNSSVKELESAVFRVVTVGSDQAVCQCTNMTFDTGMAEIAAIADVRKISGWAEIPCIQNIETNGGGQQYYNYQCMNAARQARLKTYRDIQTVTYTFAHDATNPLYGLAIAATKDDTLQVFRMSIPRAGEDRVYSGRLDFNPQPVTTVNEMETVNLSVDMVDNYAFMQLKANPVVYVKEIGYFTGMKLINGSVAGTPDTYYEIAKNMQSFISAKDRTLPIFATDKRVTWAANQGGEFMDIWDDPANVGYSVGLTVKTANVNVNRNVVLQATARDGGGAQSWPVRVLIRNELATLSYTLEASPVGKYYVDVNDKGLVTWTQTPSNSQEGRVWAIEPPSMGTFDGGYIPFSNVTGPAKVVLSGARWGAKAEVEFYAVKKVTGAIVTFADGISSRLFRTTDTGAGTVIFNKNNQDATINAFDFVANGGIVINSTTDNGVRLSLPNPGGFTFQVTSRDGYYTSTQSMYRASQDLRVTSMAGFPTVTNFAGAAEACYASNTEANCTVSLGAVINGRRFYFLSGAASGSGTGSILILQNANTEFNVNIDLNPSVDASKRNLPLMIYGEGGKWKARWLGA